MMRATTRRGIGLLAALLAVPALIGTSLAGTASAGQFDPPGDEYDSGYTVEVSITFSGEAAPDGGGSRTVRVAPICWWQPANKSYTDAVASLDWYELVTHGLQTRGTIGRYGPRRIWKEAADAETAGTRDVSWYRAFCKDPKDYERYDAGDVENTDPLLDNPEDYVTYYYRAFDAGVEVPAPLVDPAELARATRDVMVIPVPQTDRNPKIQSAGAPTLVGLPTWFWVTDPAAVGGEDGKRDITATLGDVFATVTAEITQDGLHLNSPAGGTECSPSKALVKYSDSTPETSACTVRFTRASVAYPDGYPLAASTDWGATWFGSGGATGTLEGLARNFVANVPVAEVQNIVTRR